VERQRQIVKDALEALKEMAVPGTVRELPYQWRR
jgi:transcriptional regulator with GAF, ATPase, and Fis domain